MILALKVEILRVFSVLILLLVSLHQWRDYRKNLEVLSLQLHFPIRKRTPWSVIQ
ncbi:hypothetical protein HanIR_Chr08g0348211 [Helianthus annuus]|nr:hypothetical protein HanIR_Chr08g0348211 [Helianthus annuus]